MMYKKVFCAISAGAVLLGLASIAQATPTNSGIINFDQGGNTRGTLTYGGHGGALFGKHIKFKAIAGQHTPENSAGNSYLDCSNCFLSFNTGDYIGKSHGIYTFGGGGKITLTGTAIDQSGDTVADGTLLSGSFKGTQLVTKQKHSKPGTLLSFGSETLDAALLGYFGIGPNVHSEFAVTNIIGFNRTKSNGGFSASMDVDIRPFEFAPDNPRLKPVEITPCLVAFDQADTLGAHHQACLFADA